jgi:hypothetical protein
MKPKRYFIIVLMVLLLGTSLAGCHPKMDVLNQAEKIFIKKVDKTADKLDLNAEQKIQLEKLKLDIRKNFQDGQVEKKEAMAKIREEGLKGDPDIQKMTSLLQESMRAETQRINRAFDLMLGFQKNLNESQKKRLGQMISDWVGKWK